MTGKPPVFAPDGSPLAEDGTVYEGFGTLTPRQQEAYNILLRAEPESYTLLGYGGAAGGAKTHYIAQVAERTCLSYPGSRVLMARQELSTLKTTTMEEFFRLTPRRLVHRRNESENWVELRMPTWPQGIVSKVFFRGLADFQKKGSEAFNLILIDEASEVEADAAEYLLTRLRWRLPRVVQDLKMQQCRGLDPLPAQVPDYRCERCLKDKSQYGACEKHRPYAICGKKCPSGLCEKHGRSYIGDGVKYGFVCASNPWPGWFTDWFYKGQFKEALESLPMAKVHFVQALPKDNPHLPEHYEALQRSTLSPEMAARMVEGRFDVFVGLVYEAFSEETHIWRNPNPPEYTRVIGGLDFGDESETADYTAGIIGLVTKSNRILWVEEFKERGPGVGDRQTRWMMEMEQRWAEPIGKRIQWVADKSQTRWINEVKHIFRIQRSSGDRVENGIRQVAKRLNPDINGIPGMHFLPHLKKAFAELAEYRRNPKTHEIEKHQEDHICDTLRYSIELLDRPGGDPDDFFKNQMPVVG